ncbi:hypothetical protein SS50377_23123 [Spironucleus salmonicida]|nr:hypothetical protein SS50377_23123 [Spironucleus salmonicida]
MINIQSNILSICNFQTEKVHTMYCKQIVQTTRQEGISFDILQNLLIQGHIKHRYSGISKNQDLFSIYNMPFPFSVQDIFSNDFYYKIDLERDKIIYLPPLNIWNEDDLINGLLQQKFIEGVRWSLIKPQLNIQHFYTTNQLLDIGLEAGDHASRQDRDSISQSTRYTTEQIASIQLRQQNQHRIAAHSAPSIESQLEKFPKIVQYLSRSRKEKFTFDIVDWNGEFVLYQRRPTKLIPVEKAKCEELLSQFSEVHFDQAKNICQEMLQKTLIKDSSKGKKKQKERKSQDKWLNDHLNDPDTDQWYLSSRQ